MYWNVPTSTFGRCAPWLRRCAWRSRSRAASPAASGAPRTRNTFAGLRSRCTSPASCAAREPRADLDWRSRPPPRAERAPRVRCARRPSRPRAAPSPGTRRRRPRPTSNTSTIDGMAHARGAASLGEEPLLGRGDSLVGDELDGHRPIEADCAPDTRPIPPRPTATSSRYLLENVRGSFTSAPAA